MKIDIENLSVAELDDLISKAAERRASMQPQHPKTRPEAMHVVVDPIWYTWPIPDTGLIGFSLRHSGFGWAGFAIPPHEILKMISVWAEIIATASAAADARQKNATSSAAPASGGGTMH